MLECSPDGTKWWDDEFKYFRGPEHHRTEYVAEFWEHYPRRFRDADWERWELMLLAQIVPSHVLLGDVDLSDLVYDDLWSASAEREWDELLNQHAPLVKQHPRTKECVPSKVSGKEIIHWLCNALQEAIKQTCDVDGYVAWGQYVPTGYHW